MAGMYPDDQTLSLFGETLSWPGLKDGKFSNGSFDDPLVKPSFIPAETLNLIVDNLNALITKMGGTPNNTSATQLAELFVKEVQDAIRHNATTRKSELIDIGLGWTRIAPIAAAGWYEIAEIQPGSPEQRGYVTMRMATSSGSLAPETVEIFCDVSWGGSTYPAGIVAIAPDHQGTTTMLRVVSTASGDKKFIEAYISKPCNVYLQGIGWPDAKHVVGTGNGPINPSRNGTLVIDGTTLTLARGVSCTDWSPSLVATRGTVAAADINTITRQGVYRVAYEGRSGFLLVFRPTGSVGVVQILLDSHQAGAMLKYRVAVNDNTSAWTPWAEIALNTPAKWDTFGLVKLDVGIPSLATAQYDADWAPSPKWVYRVLIGETMPDIKAEVTKYINARIYPVGALVVTHVNNPDPSSTRPLPSGRGWEYWGTITPHYEAWRAK